MDLNISSDWITRMAEKEDGKTVSAGRFTLEDGKIVSASGFTLGRNSMTNYLPLAAAADRLSMSAHSFTTHVHQEIADKWCVVGEWLYSTTEIDQWKHDRDVKRRESLDALRALMEEEGSLFD